MLKKILIFSSVFLLSAMTCFAQVQNDKIHNKFNKKFQITLHDSWFGKDKADHLLVSAFLSAQSYYVFRVEQNMSHERSLYFSTSITFSIGIFKEIKDGFTKGNAASLKDIVADIVGIGLGSLLFSLSK